MLYHPSPSSSARAQWDPNTSQAFTSALFLCCNKSFNLKRLVIPSLCRGVPREEVADEQERLKTAHKVHRGWMLQRQRQDRESPEAANSLPQRVFHLSASFPGLIHQLLASQATVPHPSPGTACCFSNFSQQFTPNIPHKYFFPFQKALGKHMRGSREAKSKQIQGTSI